MGREWVECIGMKCSWTLRRNDMGYIQECSPIMNKNSIPYCYHACILYDKHRIPHNRKWLPRCIPAVAYAFSPLVYFRVRKIPIGGMFASLFLFASHTETRRLGSAASSSLHWHRLYSIPQPQPITRVSWSWRLYKYQLERGVLIEMFFLSYWLVVIRCSNELPILK